MEFNKEMNPKFNRNNLEQFYQQYNRREYVHPDPLEFLYDYSELQDREIVGLIASSLAYGRVAQILKSVSYVLKILTQSPSLFLKDTSFNDLQNMFTGFKHRFATGNHLTALLTGAKQATENTVPFMRAFLPVLKKMMKQFFPLSLFLCGE